MSHKRLKQYSVIAGGRLSKVIEFSKGEAEIYVKNFIETHLSHAVLKASGGLKDIVGYFTDVPTMKEKLQKEANAIISGINAKIEEIRTPVEEGMTAIPESIQNELIEKLEEAKGKVALAKTNIGDITDDSDFNKENIDKAKDHIEESLDKIRDYMAICEDDRPGHMISGYGIGNIVFTLEDPDDPDGGGQTISVDAMQSRMHNGLNKVRKWQFDLFEEEFSAELYVGSYHEYKYAKTKNELFEQLVPALQSLGADIELDPDLYKISGTELVRNDGTNKINIETDIKDALTAKHIDFKRINIDWHDKNYDPNEGEDTFDYPY